MKITYANIVVMTSAVLAAGFALVGSVQVSAAAARAQSVPPDSFLRFRVDTVQQLIDQVKADPMVRNRYCQMFNVSPANLVAYIQKNVVESYVPATKTYRVWCVTKNGKLFTINTRFNAGTRVFALRNGTPIMKWACGNPVISRLPAPPVKPRTVARAPAVPIEKTATYMAVIPTEMAPPTPVVTAMAPELVSVVPEEKVAGSSEVFGPVPAAGIGGISPLIPIAGAAGLIALGGGSTSGRIIALGGGGGTPVNSNGLVPEFDPAVMVLLGLLPLPALMFVARRTSAKRCRRQD